MKYETESFELKVTDAALTRYTAKRDYGIDRSNVGQVKYIHEFLAEAEVSGNTETARMLKSIERRKLRITIEEL